MKRKRKNGNKAESSSNHAFLEHDGKRFKLDMFEDSYGAKFLNISTLFSESGISTFDPGLMSTAFCSSYITYIDGQNAILQHRGIMVEELVAKNSYEEVSYLLFHGDLPDKEQLQEFNDNIVSNREVSNIIAQTIKLMPKDAHPMNIMSIAIGMLASIYGKSFDISDKHSRMDAIFKILGKSATIAAMAYKHGRGEEFVKPKPQLSFSDNLLHMMFSKDGSDCAFDPVALDIFNKLLILHIDHEQNASTTSVRVTGSSGANIYSTIATGMTSLSGTSHGGANEEVVKMLQSIGSVDKIPEFLDRVKNKKVRLMGFGHRVYKNFDPRGKVIKESCDKLLDSLEINRELFDIALKLEEAALNDEYFTSRKLFPNIDFYSGIIYMALGIPSEMFTVMFAVARTAGWLAQYNEMVEQPGSKIVRPRQVYLGDIAR